MVYGLISDIHGSLEALEAVLAELSGVDAFICPGDIVGYGPDPGACVERVRELPNLTCVAGNHDLAAVGDYNVKSFNLYAGQAIEWTGRQLSAEQKTYLSSLRRADHVADAEVVHGSLAEQMAYITDVGEATECFDEMQSQLCFIGHTHVAEYYRRSDDTGSCEQVPLLSGGGIKLEAGMSYIINPGAVGQPRDRNPAAAFGIYDPEARTVEVRRIEYDIARVQEKMQRAGLPADLADRLARGR